MGIVELVWERLGPGISHLHRPAEVLAPRSSSLSRRLLLLCTPVLGAGISPSSADLRGVRSDLPSDLHGFGFKAVCHPDVDELQWWRDHSVIGQR